MLEAQSKAGSQASQPSAATRIASVLEDGSVPYAKRAKGDPPIEQTSQTIADVLEKMLEFQQSQQVQMLEFQRQQSTAFTLAVSQLTQVVAAATNASAPSIAPVPLVPAQPVTSTSSHHEAVQIPAELDKIMTRRAKSYQDDLFKLHKAKALLEKRQEEVKTFEQSADKYPLSHKPFRSPVAFIELDAPLSQASAGDFQFSCTVPAGTSRREAMRLVHRQTALFQSLAMLEAQKQHVDDLSPCVDKSVLTSLVQDVLAEAGKPELAEEVGLQKPFSEVLTQQNIEARVEALYTKIYTSLNHKPKSDATAAEQSAQAATQKDSDIIGQPP